MTIWRVLGKKRSYHKEWRETDVLNNPTPVDNNIKRSVLLCNNLSWTNLYQLVCKKLPVVLFVMLKLSISFSSFSSFVSLSLSFQA